MRDAADEPNPTAMASFEDIAEEILGELALQDRLREEALHRSRQVIRASSLTIRAVHRHDFQEAEEQLSVARSDLLRLGEIGLACPIFTATGYIADAQKEYAEASITLALVRGDPVPRPADLAVPVAPYMNGLAETVGELRRSILDALRQETAEPCEERLAIMQQIYDFLVTVDYPDALTGGLRRNTDNVRRILENTRADLTTALRQQSLQSALERLEKQLPGR